MYNCVLQLYIINSNAKAILIIENMIARLKTDINDNILSSLFIIYFYYRILMIKLYFDISVFILRIT